MSHGESLLEVSEQQCRLAMSGDGVSCPWKRACCQAQQCQAASGVSSASCGYSYLSMCVLPGPNCSLNVTNASVWPSQERCAGVNDGLAATTACNLLAVHDDAGGTDKVWGHETTSWISVMVLNFFYQN